MRTYKIALFAASLLFTTSCSDFLDKLPLTEPNSETFLSNPEAVNNYINGLYIDLPSIGMYDMGMYAEEKNSDNIIAEIYDRRLNGELLLTNGGIVEWQNGYNNLRKVNYFLSKYQVVKEDENEDVLSLKGEAYFFRAYWHFYLLQKFGKIPLMDAFWDTNATIEGLQIPASDRAKVVEFILEDLKTAKGMLHPRSKYSGLRISKEAAILMSMRVALYEGTWEKYHKGTEFDATENKSEMFLKRVLEEGDELFGMGITLNTKNNDPTAVNVEDAYSHLFNSKDLSKVPEVILWRKYSIADGVITSLSANLGAGYVDTKGPAGITQSLIDNYLKNDGSFINPDDDSRKDFVETFKNRDARMLAAIMHQDCKFKSALSKSKPMNIVEFNEEEKMSRPPFLTESGSSKNLSGYHIRLAVDTTYVDGQSETALPVMRVSEALLAYAEAAEELGICTPEILGKTIKPLRERAGVEYHYPFIKDINFSDFGYQISANLQEIRRERRSELALQGFRFDDLMRWRAHNLIVGKRGKGAYFGTDSKLYKSFDPETPDLATIKTDENGFLDPMKDILTQGYQFNLKRDYLLPIPPSEISLNQQLVQNPGWDK